MKRIFIWVDDERDIKNGWTRKQDDIEFVIVRNYNDAIKALEENKNEKIFISLDHDLGIGLNGYDIVKYIVGFEIPIAGFAIHSMNPVGAKNMSETLEHYGYHKMIYFDEIHTI